FTSGGTEADNLAVKGAVLLRPPAERHLVCSAVEHHAVLDAAAWAEADAGAQVDLAPVDGSGRVDLDRLATLLRPGRTALGAVMAANNEVGTGPAVAAPAAPGPARGGGPARRRSWPTPPGGSCSATPSRPPACPGSTWPPTGSTCSPWPPPSSAAPPVSAPWSCGARRPPGRPARAPPAPPGPRWRPGAWPPLRHPPRRRHRRVRRRGGRRPRRPH